MREEAASELRQAMKQLPPEQARAIVMAGVYGMTAMDVARAEGIPLGTAKTRIRAAMGKLRTGLDRKEVPDG
jgi:RNA polymerase sigma-70 factor (ECF subfamily)